MSEMHKQSFSIQGMSCAACQARIERTVRALDGVDEVSVQLLQNSMTVRYNNGLTVEHIIKAVTDAGYKATPSDDSVIAHTSSEDAAAAAALESRRYKKLIASVILTIILMVFSMGPMVGINLISSAITSAYIQLVLCMLVMGLNLHYFNSGFKGLIKLSPNMDSLVAMSVGASFIYSCASLGHMPTGLTMEHAHDFALYFESCATILTLVSVGKYLESKAKRKAVDAVSSLYELAPEKVTVRRRKGASASCCAAQSSQSCASSNDCSAVPTGDVAAAASNEAVVVDANAAAATGSVAAAASNGAVVGDDAEVYEVTVPVSEVKPGDEVVMRPGDRAGVDGVVIEGSAFFDESALTGEPMPVKKEAGATVQSATFVSSGYLVYRVEKVGKDTALSKIIELVNEANSQKAPIARLADKVSYYFVPSVIALAIITGAIWIMAGAPVNVALTFAVSVLVISCPCALGLATPTAITVATGRAASLGVLFKSPEALENLQRINTLVFDKTGTVTVGKMDVVNVKVLHEDELNLQRVLKVAHALESRSEHPIAKAVAAYAIKTEQTSTLATTSVAEDVAAANASAAHDVSDTSGAELEVLDFTNLDGKGVTAVIDGKRYFMGSQKFLEVTIDDAKSELPEKEVDNRPYDPDIKEERKHVGNQYVTIYLFDEHKCYAIFELGDELKDTSVEAVAEVKALGISPVMVSGDSEEVVSYVSSQAGITSYIGACMPQDKAEYINMIRKEGAIAGMIGDGVNDAPSLRAADVGISLTGATDIATSCADVILMRNDMRSLAHAIELSRLTIRNIKENLFWAFIYNIICIPLAAGLLYVPLGMQLNPMIAALMMSLSSLCVVSNALRLRNQDLEIAIARSDENNAKVGLAAHESVFSIIKAHATVAALRQQIDIKSSGEASTTEAAMQHSADSACQSNSNDDSSASSCCDNKDTLGVNVMQKIVKIDGMSCQHCVKSVTKALGAVPGCTVDEVSLENKCARVTVDASVTDEALLKAVNDDGFEAKGVENA